MVTRYNGTGNGKRDMHSERMPVMVRKVRNIFNMNVASHMGITLSEGPVEGTKPPISSGLSYAYVF